MDSVYKEEDERYSMMPMTFANNKEGIARRGRYEWVSFNNNSRMEVIHGINCLVLPYLNGRWEGAFGK